MSENDDSIYDSIVIGAGVSGLVLASRLREKFEKIKILEKSKSVGGRIATRRDGSAVYDHGAQFYKIKKGEEFQLDQIWSKHASTTVWFEKEQSLHKASSHGLTKLAKSICKLEEVQFNEKVTRIVDAEYISVECESGHRYRCRRLYVSAPLPQALTLLNNSSIQYADSLNRIEFASALVGLFEFSPEIFSQFNFSYLENPSSTIFSISNQQSKKVSPVPAVTVVMNPLWSRQNFEAADDFILDQIQAEFKIYLKSFEPHLSDKILKAQLKKWKFSHPLSKFDQLFSSVGARSSIFLLGDAFGGSGIRGAINSAISVPI